MTKGDFYTKEIITKILEEGTLDENPRPSYIDGTKAHTYSINHGMCTYDQTKNESPLITLRPIAVKSSIGELLWIYRDQDSNIYNLETKYNVRWWRDWCINPYHYNSKGDLVEGPNDYMAYYFDEKGVHYYDVFSVYQIENEDYYIKTDFSGNEFESFIKTLKDRSYHDFGINVTKDDSIITLSTCSDSTYYRVVLHAVKRKESSN